MTIAESLEKLDELLANAWSLPLSGGKCLVDAETIKAITDDIRINMPSEIKQAKSIVADRGDIISTAKKEADGIIISAEERAKAMIAQEEIVRQAQVKANEIVVSAQKQAREMRTAAADYVDEMMKRTEDSLSRNLADVRKTRQGLRMPGKSPGTQGLDG